MELKEQKNRLIAFAGKYKYVLLVLALGIGIMLLPVGKNETHTQVIPTEGAKQESDICAQLEDILSAVQGVGKVEVMVSIASGASTVYEKDETVTSGENGSKDSQTVIITDGNRGENGLIQQMNPPRYLGAVVVCQGADRADIRLWIIEAVSKITGLGADRISVLKMQ